MFKSTRVSDHGKTSNNGNVRDLNSLEDKGKIREFSWKYWNFPDKKFNLTNQFKQAIKKMYLI